MKKKNIINDIDKLSMTGQADQSWLYGSGKKKAVNDIEYLNQDGGTTPLDIMDISAPGAGTPMTIPYDSTGIGVGQPYNTSAADLALENTDQSGSTAIVENQTPQAANSFEADLSKFLSGGGDLNTAPDTSSIFNVNQPDGGVEGGGGGGGSLFSPATVNSAVAALASALTGKKTSSTTAPVNNAPAAAAPKTAAMHTTLIVGMIAGVSVVSVIVVALIMRNNKAKSGKMKK